MELDREFIDFSVRKLRQLASRIDDCLARLTPEQIWARGGDEQNAIGNLVLHLCGNIRQWIGFGVEGKPDIRVRDREFSARGDITPEELRERLKSAVEETSAALEAVTAERLGEMTKIQVFEISVLEAIYHVVEHFAMHTGQIIFATKMLTGTDLAFYGHLKTPGLPADKTP